MGWQTEAFLSNAGANRSWTTFNVPDFLSDFLSFEGSKNASVDTAILGHVLRPWMPPAVDLSPENIEIIVGRKQSLNLAEFCQLCDSLC
jgi:hypothetical protein